MDLSYIAGFFDGEGNFKTTRIKMKNGNIAHQIQIRLTNVNKEILEKIKEFLGYGHITKRIRTNDWSDIYNLIISKKKETFNFLQKIKDLLIEKKPQAEFLLENFDFNVGKNNMYFDVEKFRSFISRKNVIRKYKTILRNQVNSI